MTLGGDYHQYLALTMPVAHYANFSHTAFIIPIDPDLTPMYPARAISAAIANIKARHDEQICQWYEYNAIMQALKNQLIAAIDDAYLQGIKDPVTEYYNVSFLQMIEYLYDNYRKIPTMSLRRLNCFSSKYKNALILQARRRAHSQQSKYLIWLFSTCSAPLYSI